MKIKKIYKEKFQGKVYNIGVEDNNNYFAQNILVHNCYVSASSKGEHWKNVCDTWNRWMKTFPEDTVLPADDPVLQDIFQKPTKEDLQNINNLRVKMLFRNNAKHIILTEKPYQIAIGI